MRTCEEIINKIKEYRDNFDEQAIVKAYEFAKKKHEGQFRKTGEPFFSHPAEVAYILAELRMDVPTIVAGLLHDTVEDTDTTLEEIEENFGKEVSFIVKGVTKLESFEFKSKEEKDAEAFRNLLISLAEDIRVLIVKLADRLHNMRTLEGLSKESIIRKAQETLTIYAPLANRLGMYRIKNELEDLSLKYLEPQTYEEIRKKVLEVKGKLLPYFEKIIETVKKELEVNKIKGEIQWRFKHIYGIYRKMVTKGIPFEEVYDVAGIRIITETVAQCYQTLGIIHSLWTPVPGRFKDYIATPKPNMYQSLHTTVVGPKGQFIEFQIRTYKMHQVAEMGIAAHWKYKEGGGALTEAERERFLWLRSLLEWVREEKNPKDFIDAVRKDLYGEEVYVFTPKGDLKTLPVGSTPVDFAYAIHTSIGHRCRYAKVNGKIVPLSYVLQSGDRVEIITGSEERPSRDWLKFVKTSKAKSAIKNFLRKQANEEARKLGEEMLDKFVRKLSDKSLSTLLEEEGIEEKIKSLGYQTVESLLIDIGYFKLNPETVARKLLGIQVEQEKKTKQKGVSVEIPEVKVNGISNIMVIIAECCNPLPGDEVVGIVNSGKGIEIHTANCVVARQVMESSPGRVVSVEFPPSNKFYKAKIRVSVEDVPGMLASVSSAIAKQGINIASSLTKSTATGRAVLDFVLQVRNKEELSKVMNAIKNIKGVIAVKRIYRERIKAQSARE